MFILFDICQKQTNKQAKRKKKNDNNYKKSQIKSTLLSKFLFPQTSFRISVNY